MAPSASEVLKKASVELRFYHEEYPEALATIFSHLDDEDGGVWVEKGSGWGCQNPRILCF